MLLWPPTLMPRSMEIATVIYYPSSPILLHRNLALISARTCEDVVEPEVILVAGVLDEHTTGGPGDRRRPRFCPSGRIAHRESVINPVVGHAGPPLHQPHILRRAFEASMFVEVHRLHHQRVVLPMAARVPQPLAHARIEMRTPIQRDDARLMDLL